MGTKILSSLFLVVALTLLGTSAASAQGAAPRGGFRLAPLLMQSTAFEDGGIVPQKMQAVVESSRTSSSPMRPREQ
jgi:hypothetical protein